MGEITFCSTLVEGDTREVLVNSGILEPLKPPPKVEKKEKRILGMKYDDGPTKYEIEKAKLERKPKGNPDAFTFAVYRYKALREVLEKDSTVTLQYKYRIFSEFEMKWNGSHTRKSCSKRRWRRDIISSVAQGRTE